MKNARPADAHRAAVPRRRVRSVQPSQLRSAGQHRRQPDVRQDHQDAPADRRSRLVAADSARRAAVVLRWASDQSARRRAASLPSLACVAALWVCRAGARAQSAPRTRADDSFGLGVLSVESRAGCGDSGGPVSARRRPDRLLRGIPGVRPLRDGSASAALADYIRRKYRGPPHRPRDRDHQRRARSSCSITATSCFQTRRSSSRASPSRTRASAAPVAASPASGSAARTRETLKLALALHPSTEQRVRRGRTRRTRQDVDSVRAELSGFSRRVQLTYIERTTLPRAAARSSKRSRRAACSSHLAARGATEDTPDPMKSRASSPRPRRCRCTAPSISTSALGIVGGVMRGTRDTGTRVGEMALQILDGRRAQDIPVEDAPLVPIFDWRQLKRWGIDPSRLPPGSNILFCTPTVWEAVSPVHHRAPSSWSPRSCWRSRDCSCSAPGGAAPKKRSWRGRPRFERATSGSGSWPDV